MYGTRPLCDIRQSCDTYLDTSGFEITEDDYNAFIQEIKEGEFHLLDHDSVGWGVVYLTFCPENNEQEGLRAFCANVLGKYLKEV